MSISEKLKAVQDEATCLIRTGRATREGVAWTEPYVSGIQVQRDRASKVCAINVLNSLDDFTEFDPRYHQESDGLFVAEDYYLEIFEVRN